MAINYKIVKQGNTPLTDPDREYYTARVCSRSKISLKKIAERISQRCTLSKADIYGTLVELTTIIPECLLENQSVELGSLGTFSCSISSQSEASPEEVTWRSIKGLKVQFRAGKELKEELRDVQFKRVDE